jgi:exodeoxyribonuclease-5
VTWTSQQEAALAAIKSWLGDKRAPQIFRLFGYAGVGKTELAKEMKSMVRGSICYAAFTGKAASVMRRKSCDGASTIHSLIYSLKDVEFGEPEFILNRDSDVRYSKLVVIDECSMIDKIIGEDLLSFGTKILVIGDPAQLPPVNGAGYFTAHEPDILLTEIHRQAQDNPIIGLSMKIRAGEQLQAGDYGAVKVIPRKDINSEIVLAADQVIVGLNRTRESYNNRMRTLLGREDKTPVPGDKIICLRNDRKKGIFNGTMWSVRSVEESRRYNALDIQIESLDEEEPPKEVTVLKNFFDGTESELNWKEKAGTQEFAYGFVCTAHKCQGSQFDNVVVFDESGSFRDNATRWAYTSATRAAEKLTWVLP